MRFTLSIVLSFTLFAVVVNSDDVARIRRVQRTQGSHSILSEVTGAIAPDENDAEFWERELGKNGSNSKSKSKSHSKGGKGKGGSKGSSKSGSKSKDKRGSKHGSKYSKKSKKKSSSKKSRMLREAAAPPKISSFMQKYGMVKDQEDVDFWDRELRKNGSNGKGKGKGSSKKSKSKKSKKSGTSGCGGDKHDKAKKCKQTCDEKMKWSNSKNGKIYASVKYCGFYEKYSCKGQYNCKDKKAHCRADCHKYFL